eukprot:763576-Hanusia_phi.AAC.2
MRTLSLVVGLALVDGFQPGHFLARTSYLPPSGSKLATDLRSCRSSPRVCLLKMADDISSPQASKALQRLKEKADRKRERLVKKMERLESRISDRMSRAMEKMPGKLSKFSAKGQKIVSLVRSVTPDSPKKLALVVLVCMALYPIASSAWIALSAATAVTILMFNMLAVCLTPASMFVGAGLAFFQPVLLGTLSSMLTAMTALVASVIAYFPRSRSLLGLIIASLLPFFNAWLAMVPAKTYEVDLRVLQSLPY